MNRKGQYGARFINIVLAFIMGAIIFIFFPAFSEMTFFLLNMTTIANDNYNIIGALIPVFWICIAIGIPLFTLFVGGGGEV